MFRRALAVLRSLAGTGRPDDLDALIVATREPSVWCRACGCWNGHAHPDCWGAEPKPYPLTSAALANLRDTLADWHDEVWALADVELAEMTRGDA